MSLERKTCESVRTLVILGVCIVCALAFCWFFAAWLIGYLMFH